MGEGCGRSAGGHVSRASEANEEEFWAWLYGEFIGGVLVGCWGHICGRYRGEVALIVLGVPQHASLFSPVGDVPSSTSSVPIFSLD